MEKKMISTSLKIRFPYHKQTSWQEYFLKTELCLISIMVSTSRKKALKSVSISRNKITFKNWILPNFRQQEDKVIF